MANFAYLLSHEKFDSVNDIVIDDEDVVEDNVARKVFNKLKAKELESAPKNWVEDDNNFLDPYGDGYFGLYDETDEANNHVYITLRKVNVNELK